VDTTQELPQLGSDVFLTDGGIETDLIFNRGIEIPEFASFVLHDDAEAEAVVRDYFLDYLRIGATHGYGLVLETLTWRASSDWAPSLGYDDVRLRAANERAVAFLRDLRDAEAGSPVVVSGCIGPRGDAYRDLGTGDYDEAERYHRPQVEVLTGSGVDLVTALTLTNPAEAVGVARAAAQVGVPVAISFTVETDGNLPTGAPLSGAIAEVDAATDSAPAYYMINCAHPEHFSGAFTTGDPVIERIRGVRANASRMSHAELDESEVLDDGDPVELGSQLAGLHANAAHVTVLGGCCGTDHRHIAEIAAACRALSGG
jgi:S-methylmethionine-dependent homocysteine/selenocysteine methylase